MKPKKHLSGPRNEPPPRASEVFVLPGGKVLAHNVTPEMARVLSEIDPGNEAMRRRADLLQPSSRHESAPGN